jgi:hypothetical protein
MPLSPTELTAARAYLHQALLMIRRTRTLFVGIGDSPTAARLRAIQERIADEIAAVRRNP